MDYYAIAGMVVIALIAILGYMNSIKKEVQNDREPIEKMNISITKLNENFKHMLYNDEVRDSRLNKHGDEIDKIVERQRTNEKTLENHELRLQNLEKKS